MKEKRLMILNIALGLTAVIFLLHLFGVGFPSLGQAQYFLDQEVPVCIVNYGDNYVQIEDENLCCFEVQKQLRCDTINTEIEGKWVNKHCYTGDLNYYLNNKNFNYCKKEGYYV